MNFNERGNIPSCSALGRIRNCGGSWALSQGVEDTSSKEAEDGQDVHDHLKRIVLGELKNPQTEPEQLAWRLWGHIQKSAFAMYGDIELIWQAEKRLWMTNDNLEPVLSGQYDVICYPAVEGSFGAIKVVALFDAKTGWQAGDVPRASRNDQLIALAELISEQHDAEVWGAVVREWACDELACLTGMGNEWVRNMSESIHNGDYDIWHKAGLKTGDWCQFCPAKGNCPAYRDSFQLVVQQDIGEQLNPTLQIIGAPGLVRILRAAPMAEKVIEAAKAEAHRRRIAGEELPGVLWKKGNSKREIADEAKFGLRMAAEGIDLGTFQKTSIPIGAAYKAWLKHKDKKDNKAAKDEFNRVFTDCITTSENSPSIEFPD